MFRRQMGEELRSASAQYPVVTVTGPRQSGKTTLVREVFSEKPYANLESLRISELVEADPIAFLNHYPDGAVLDEIQRYPKLLSEIQTRVDESEMKGMFILIGSHQVGLHGAIAQSLAGRTSILHLLPMSMEELYLEGIEFTLDEILYRGGFPSIYKVELNPSKAYANYVQTYLERDLRQMIEVKNLQLFQRFLKLCAGRIGQIFNKENLANEVGVSAKTIGHWLSILEASYLVFLLPPYFQNFGKRIIKSPKLYFCDVGLAAYLLGIETLSQIERDPLRGNLVENLIILELIKTRWNQGLDHRLFFYRDSHKNEVDVLFQRGHELVPIEIKSAKTFNRSFLNGLISFKKLVGDRCQNPTLIYSGLDELKVKDIQLLHFSHAAKALSYTNNRK
ncbi:MAG: ATP-binding protein [Chlamydiales bacterium]|nr:ATP-binding protein [Chlamydiales bacterium]